MYSYANTVDKRFFSIVVSVDTVSILLGQATKGYKFKLLSAILGWHVVMAWAAAVMGHELPN